MVYWLLEWFRENILIFEKNRHYYMLKPISVIVVQCLSDNVQCLFDNFTISSPSNSCFLCFLTSPPDCSSVANPVYCSSGPLLMSVLASMSISMSVSVFLYISASMSMSISHISAAQILFTTVDICFWCLFLVSWLLLLTWESESRAESESGNIHRHSPDCSGPNPVYCSQRPILFSWFLDPLV